MAQIDIRRRPWAVSARGPGPLNSPKVLQWILISPAQLVLTVIAVLPLILEFYISFTDWQPVRGGLMAARWMWLKNYATLLFQDTRFLGAVFRTAFISVTSLGLEFALGLGLAVLFLRRFKGRKLLFSALLTPMMIMPVVVGYTFYLLFQREGPVSQILGWLGVQPVDWLTVPGYALTAVILTEVWHWTPLFFLILLSGLNALPTNPIRAALVLGASPWQVFWRVMFPMLRPVITIAFVIRGMEVVKLFDEVFILTRGGPGVATETISLYLYKLAFKDFRLAYAAAAAFIILVLTLVIVWRMLKSVRYQLQEEGGR